MESQSAPLTRWVLQGVPVLIGIGIATALLLHFSLGFTLLSLSVPITSLLVIQLAFYLSMYGVRKRFRQTRDLRTGFIVVGMFCLLIVLAGMYFAERIGLVAPKALRMITSSSQSICWS